MELWRKQMNERIKQLAEQYKDNIRDGFYGYDGYDVVHWCNVEDLIQDVVRECAEFVEQDQGSGEVLSRRLKEHFGVE
jgi:hypothetical protein